MPTKEIGEMPEDNEQAEMTEVGADGEKPEAQTASTNDAEELAELEALRAALKKANHEAASRRKKLDEYEKAEEERKLAEMTELEKAQAKLAEMAAQLEAAENARQATMIRSAIEREAVAQNFHDPADAWRFLEPDAVTLDGDKVAGVETALKALAKARPYLVKQAKIPNIDGEKRSTAKAGAKSDKALIARRYGIRVPENDQ